MAKVYSIQPRFIHGNVATGGWAWVDYLFSNYTKEKLPPYGSYDRDAYLAEAWKHEPILSGILNAYTERLQTRQWTVTGGKINATREARKLHDAEGGKGFTYYIGLEGLDFLATDKGAWAELGRRRKGSTFGPVLGIQHLDSVRMVRSYDRNKKTAFWYYLPEYGEAVAIPDENLLRIIPAASGRDRFRGFGYCAVSRLYDALELMIGFLQYYRQKIGNLPPQWVAIWSGISREKLETAYRTYMMERQNKESEIWPGVFNLGNDDPLNPVSLSLQSLIGLPESFDWDVMQEWWAKVVVLNIGEAIGDYWLIRHAGIGGGQAYSVQAEKARGRGTGRFIHEVELRFNTEIMPVGVTFKFDAPDDEQDKLAADILSTNMQTIERMARAGMERGEFVFTIEEVRKSAIEWGVIDPEIAGEDIPSVIGAMLKSHLPDNGEFEPQVRVNNSLQIFPIRHKFAGKTADAARNLLYLLEKCYIPEAERAYSGVEGDNGSQKPTQNIQVQAN